MNKEIQLLWSKIENRNMLNENWFLCDIKEIVEAKKVKYCFLHEFSYNKTAKVTYAEAINFLKKKEVNFINCLMSALKNAIDGYELGAYFWECPPVSKKTINKPFEFVVTKSDALTDIKQQDYSAYEEYLNKEENYFNYGCSFLVLDQDEGKLIIPTLCYSRTETEEGIKTEIEDYRNISEFVYHSPYSQSSEFWSEVGRVLEEELNKGGVRWLSTYGLEVHYLSVRIDKQPKYYQHEEYKQLSEEEKTSITEAKKTIGTKKALVGGAIALFVVILTVIGLVLWKGSKKKRG